MIIILLNTIHAISVDSFGKEKNAPRSYIISSRQRERERERSVSKYAVVKLSN